MLKLILKQVNRIFALSITVESKTYKIGNYLKIFILALYDQITLSACITFKLNQNSSIKYAYTSDNPSWQDC